jgi:hypothetical protein
VQLQNDKTVFIKFPAYYDFKGHCRVHKSPVNPMSSPLTYLLTTDFNIILLLVPASPERSLSLGSHIKSTAYSFSKTAFGKYLIFEMCHVSSQCASADCLQIRLATYHMCQPELIVLFYDYFAFLDILHLRQFCFCSFFKVEFTELSCTLLLLLSLLLLLLLFLYLLPLRSIYNHTPGKKTRF